MIAASLALWLAGPAQASAKGSVRLALLEESRIHMATTLEQPLDRLLAASPSSGTLLDSQVLPAYYAGADFRFRLPSQGEVDAKTFPAAALESKSEVAFIYPEVPTLVEALRKLAEDPASYHMAWNTSFSTRAVTASQARDPDGNALLSILLDARTENARWHNTITLVERLSWNGQDVTVLFVPKIFGGVNRLAAAAAALRKEGPTVGVARGGLFSSALPELAGPALAEALEKQGLAYSAVSHSELRHWGDVETYRSRHPRGVQFLSANLVYSSSTQTTLLPASAVVEAGGLRVGLIGVTPPGAAKYLGQAGLGYLKILDPADALASALPALRAEVDAVVVLSELDPEAAGELRRAQGVDLVIGIDDSLPPGVAPAEDESFQLGRSPLSQPLRITPLYQGCFNALTLSISTAPGRADWSVQETHRLLDGSQGEEASLPELDPEALGVTLSTSPTLIPNPRFISPESDHPTLSARQFWTLAASLVARQTGSEVSVLRVWPLAIDEFVGDIKEAAVRAWLRSEEAALVIWLKGGELRPLLAMAKAQGEAEAKGQPVRDRVRITAGGIGADGKIHGAPIENGAFYRVAMSRVLADALGLTAAHANLPLGPTVDQLVLQGLEGRAGSPPADYARWIAGQPVDPRGFWRVNFRDISLNIQNTDVVSDDAFSNVPNTRVQGFNQLLVGGVAKTDADYMRDVFKWSNTLELEYAKSRLRPRNQPPVVNTTADRISALTIGTRRIGALPEKWLANSWGPALGLQYDGQFESANGLPRRNMYSAFPGVQFYDGTWVRSMEASGAIKRDLSRTPPNTQYGFHTRWLLSHLLTPSQAALNGEFFANYFFLTHSDSNQDLRFESDASLKLQIPIRRYLTVAPFIDFYSFVLKVRPLWGYSAMTGISIGFSRIWKPQYEPF